jgi:hypothetical protein
VWNKNRWRRLALAGYVDLAGGRAIRQSCFLSYRENYGGKHHAHGHHPVQTRFQAGRDHNDGCSRGLGDGAKGAGKRKKAKASGGWVAACSPGRDRRRLAGARRTARLAIWSALPARQSVPHAQLAACLTSTQPGTARRSCR